MGSIETKPFMLPLKCNENQLPPKPIKFVRNSNIRLYHQLFALRTHPPHTPVTRSWELFLTLVKSWPSWPVINFHWDRISFTGSHM